MIHANLSTSFASTSWRLLRAKSKKTQQNLSSRPHQFSNQRNKTQVSLQPPTPFLIRKKRLMSGWMRWLFWSVSRLRRCKSWRTYVIMPRLARLMSYLKLRRKKSHKNRLNSKGKGSFKTLRKPYAPSSHFRTAVRCLLCQLQIAIWDAVIMQLKMLTPATS